MQNESTYSLIVELIKRFEEDHQWFMRQVVVLPSGTYKDNQNKYADDLTDAAAALKIIRPYY